MAKTRIVVQVKNRKVGRPDVQQLAGATIREHGPDTVLVFESEGVTPQGKEEAKRIESDTGMKSRFLNILGRV